MLAPWKKSYEQPRQHIKKQKYYYTDKVRIVKAMVFPVVVYGRESWTIKKAEHQRIDAFELWRWRRLLRVPWTARRSNQSILKKISPECSLEGLIQSWNSNILASWCEEPTHLKRPWCWERLKEGVEGDDRGWDGWMASPTQWTWVSVSSGSWWLTGRPGLLRFMGSQRVEWDWKLESNGRDFLTFLLPLCVYRGCTGATITFSPSTDGNLVRILCPQIFERFKNGLKNVESRFSNQASI